MSIQVKSSKRAPVDFGMTIRLYKEEDKEAWSKYVRENGRSTCYHQIGWKKVIEKSFKHPTYYLLSENMRGEINGVLPLVQLKSMLFGNFLVSLPYVNYGGICADTEDVRDQLANRSIQIAGETGARHIELRHTGRSGVWRTKKTSKVSMRLDLPEDPDVLRKSFSSKLRSQVQRPLREGMYARVGKEEALDDFYTVFAKNMRDLGTPVYAKDFFRNILSVFPASTWICTVRSRLHEPVAAGFLVGFRDILEIPWASSLRVFNRFSPNMLLYWTALRLACEKKYKIFDFGRSTPGEGTFKFKEQWGAKPLQLSWHYWLRNGDGLPELNPKNPKYRAAISLWKKLPVGLTKLIGPQIVKNLP